MDFPIHNDTFVNEMDHCTIKRDNFTLQKGSDYYLPFFKGALKNSVPSVFDFPDNLRKQVKERVPSKRLSVDEIQNDPEDYALPPGSSQCKKPNLPQRKKN